MVKLYRGPCCSTGSPRNEKIRKPLFHAWPSVSQKVFCVFLAYGWWSYKAYVKMPVWVAKAVRWYQLFRIAKKKAP